MTAPVVTTAAPRLRGSAVGSYDRLFYSGMGVALGITVFAGFAPSYYLRFFGGRPVATISGGPITGLVHLHAVLFTAWVVLFIVQTALVATRRVAVHRRLGVATAVVAAGMVIAGTRLAIHAAARGASPPGVDALAFLAIPIFDMILFAAFITAALVKRRDREAHKRLMLLAYVSIIVAAVARLPGVLTLGPLGFFGLAFVFVILGGIYDFFSRGRVHAVYLWGGGLFVVSVPLRLVLSQTSAWRSFAELLTK